MNPIELEKKKRNNFLLQTNKKKCELATKAKNFNLKNLVNKIHKELKLNVNCQVKKHAEITTFSRA